MEIENKNEKKGCKTKSPNRTQSRADNVKTPEQVETP